MKQQLKTILVPLLASKPVSVVAERIFGAGIPIFMLHRTETGASSSGTHTPEVIRRHLQYLKKKGHSFVSVMDVHAAVRGKKTLPPRSIAFTIDDGFLDQATIAAPVFVEFECPLTIFLITGFLDGDLWPWFSQVQHLVGTSGISSFELEFPDNRHSFSTECSISRKKSASAIIEMMKSLDAERIPDLIDQLSRATRVAVPKDPPNEFRPMTWDIARELEQKGISFGPHTISHPILANVSDQRSKREIVDSWRRMKEELVHPVPIFCYPNGRICDYGRREIDFIRNAGLVGAVSTVHEQVELNNEGELYEFNLPRFSFPDSVEDLVQYSTWIERAKQ